MTKWTYRMLQRTIAENSNQISWAHDAKEGRSPEEYLNALGAEGWELVSVVPISINTYKEWAGKTTSVQYVLKRASA